MANEKIMVRLMVRCVLWSEKYGNSLYSQTQYTMCITLLKTNRPITYPINYMNKKKEYDSIKRTMHINKYDNILDKSFSTINAKVKTQTQKETFNTQTNSKTRWGTFTYVGQQTKFITKLFKNTSLGIAFKTDNTMKPIPLLN